MKVLAGDVGGTKTSLAIFEVNGSKIDTLALEKYPSQQFGSLDEIVRRFSDTNGNKCEFASFGIAGPVVGVEGPNDHLGLLARRGVVQVDEGLAVHLLREDGKILAQIVNRK